MARDCYKNGIYLYEGTWRLSEHSDSIYTCPLPAGCKGGLLVGEDSCNYGFEGVLCGTCSSGFYLGAADDGYGECRKCASGEVLSAIQIFMIIISAGIVTSLWYYRRHRKSFHKQLLRIMPEIMLPESREEPLHGHEEQRKTHLNNSISRKGRTGISS